MERKKRTRKNSGSLQTTSKRLKSDRLITEKESENDMKNPESMKKPVREILFHALNDLSTEQFKHFKWKLHNFKCHVKRKIPKSDLKNAGQQEVVDLMCGCYGEEEVLKVCKSILEEINARDVATKLKEETQKDISSHQVPAKSDYRKHIKTKFQTLKYPNSRLGEYVHLNQKYSKLIIIDCHQLEKERKHEIMASDWRRAEKKEKDSVITIEELFKPDKHGLIPQVVVLQGAAGIGKTMTARKIMFDWACEHFCQDMFDFAIYIHCREMNLCTDDNSIMEIILKKWPNQHAVKIAENELSKEILRNPQKLLFIIDGFDESGFSFDQPEDSLCTDPWQKQPLRVLLSSLLKKKLLPESYLIVTTRPTALEELHQCLECTRHVEILGFSVEDREDFFHKFFENKDQAVQAFQTVKRNTALFTMCSIPLVCWIICTMLKEQIENGEHLKQSSNTLTAVYVQYLYSLLRFHHGKPMQDPRRNLKRLCSLAADGIWRGKELFDEEEISEHNLDQEDSLPLFLNEKISRRDIDCKCTYSFIHLSFQEFFAALYYVLEEGEVQQSPRSSNPDVMTLLGSYKTSRFDLEGTVRFLFGLLNESTIMKERLKKTLGLEVSPRLKKVLQEWVKSIMEFLLARTHTSDSTGMGLLTSQFLVSVTESRRNPQQIPRSDYRAKIKKKIEIFQSLYESQDENFIKCALDITNLSISPTNEMEVIAVAYCLQCCGSLKQLRFRAQVAEAFYTSLAKIFCANQRLKNLVLSDNEIRDEEMKLLCEVLEQPHYKLKRLCLFGCYLHGASFESLAHVLSKNQRLKELVLSVNDLQDEEVKLLCESMNHPLCKLEKLRLDDNSLTGACCEYLARVLRGNQNLKELHLSSDKIDDIGMKFLCIGLKHSNSRLYKLCMNKCSLTADCCGDLAEVFKKNQSLKELYLCRSEIKDKGVKLLCEGLKHPDSKLEKLVLHYCRLTSAVLKDVCTALTTKQSRLILYIGITALEEPDKKQFCDALEDKENLILIVEREDDSTYEDLEIGDDSESDDEIVDWKDDATDED